MILKIPRQLRKTPLYFINSDSFPAHRVVNTPVKKPIIAAIAPMHGINMNVFVESPRR
jgi:hypothetical protein